MTDIAKQPPTAPPAPAPDFLDGGGEMGVRIRAHDWNDTPLGPPALWPQTLKTLVGLMLMSRQPMFMAWGAAQIWLYNDAFMPILGGKHPAALGRPAMDVWTEARADLEPLFQRVFAGEAVHMEDFKLELDRRGRLEEAHFSFSYTPARDETGKVAGLFGACIDVTEQRLVAQSRMESALQQSEEQFRLLVKSVTDYAIYMLDPAGRVSSWNLGAQRIKGYLPEEIIGSHFSRFYTPEDLALGIPQKGLAEARLTGRFETEGWRLRKDGSRFWAHVVIDAIPGEDGQIVGFAKITRDVTERRTTQQALEEAREALFQSQKLEAIGQLTGGIAHDFNNLLMATLGSLELLQRRLPDDPAMTRLVDNAIQGAKRGATLTQRMLAFARRQELKQESFDLAELVRGMEELLARSLGGAVKIETSFPADLPPVESDAAQVESALLNLAVNARDSMPHGGRIIITARHELIEEATADLAAGSYVCLSVSDAGEGMDAETLARATEPFFTTKGVGKGTGLGLPMIHGLASQSGGALRLRSQPGEGTTVELVLPVATRAPETRQPSPPVGDPGRHGPSLLVLVVDDDELVLMNTVAILEDLGHIALQANHAEEALTILRGRADIDLLLTDQAMPGTTGIELIRRALAERPGLKAILATGYSELPAGQGSDVPRIAKPFDQRDLANMLALVAPAPGASWRQ